MPRKPTGLPEGISSLDASRRWRQDERWFEKLGDAMRDLFDEVVEFPVVYGDAFDYSGRFKDTTFLVWCRSDRSITIERRLATITDNDLLCLVLPRDHGFQFYRHQIRQWVSQYFLEHPNVDGAGWLSGYSK